MPHVVSQMGPREWPQQNDPRVTTKAQALNNNLKPPSVPPRRRKTNGTTPSLSLLVTSNNGNYWSSEANRLNLRQFSPDKYTPVSAVDSVFELSSPNTAGSPDSVISIAELEDTSPNAVKPLGVASDSKSPQSPALSVSSVHHMEHFSHCLHTDTSFRFMPQRLLMPSMNLRQKTSVF
jgi:hypothetical protein